MENIKEINLAELLSALLRKVWLIVLCAVVAGALVYAYTVNFVTPMYQSRITVYVNNTVITNANNNLSISATDLATSQRLVATYINILESNFVLDPVAEEVTKEVGYKLTASHIRSMIVAAPMDETEVFEVRVSNADPQLASKIANKIADVAPEKIEEIVVGSSTKIIDRAKPAASPYSPIKSRNTTFGMIGGALIAVCVVVLQTLLDVRVKGEEDLALISTAPVLGLIPDLALESKDSYGYSGYKYSAYSSAYKAESNSGSEEADV